MLKDVPSLIDLQAPGDALNWEQSAMARPGRDEMMEFIANHVAQNAGAPLRLLELGSGPGFLAARILGKCAPDRYAALDFSAAMHELARKRLADKAHAVEFVERSFRNPDWTEGLGRFDCVVTMQAVHELRHKDYAPALHEQVRSVMAQKASYLVCDHFFGAGGMANADLYMAVGEQAAALRAAGFERVRRIAVFGGLACHHAQTDA